VPYRSVTHAGVTLLCFPPYDEVLTRLAGERLDGLADPTPKALQASLRATYPQVVIRPRESIAALGGGTAWYVYRDGRFSPFGDDGPWWEAPDAARIEIDAEGRYVGANAAALELIGVDLATLRGMRTGDLTVASTRPTVAWFWQLLEDVGELHSTSILATPDGRQVPVEYRLVRGATPDDVSISYMRAIPVEAAEPNAAVKPPEA
jgi:PAS domain-containing protein